ncbi:hypothetical protein E8E12_002412 [Didymella heteroderae]|uniref:Uncharacterized protein n=1 Tax=Didymella heteroderae TaxID=1769908 RepID=A0A9P4WHA0_9PLEO|nr:hypothetical protein E8E12_002412 [Didymella heteroderae]
MRAPHPIILCGKTEAIGAVVIANLQPEFETIEFIQTVDAGKHIIPPLLRGETPPPSSSSLGTKDFSRTPVAVVLGGAFDDHAIAELRTAAERRGAKEVPWLRPDASKPAPPPGPEYGKAMVQRIKSRVKELEANGELGQGGVVWF